MARRTPSPADTASDGSAERPLVSVVVTAYNYAEFLAGAVRSVLGQTYPHFEIILVDDGSTDSTPEIARALAADPRISYIRQENAGQAAAKNRGVTGARGDLIAFLDADDLWMPQKLSRQVPLFERDPGVGVVFSRALWIDGAGRAVKVRALRPRRGRVLDDLIVDNFVPFSSAVVRREAVEEAGGFDQSLRMGIDWDLWLRLACTYRFDYVDEPLIRYRVGHPGQMSKKIEERMIQSDTVMERFLRDNPGLVSPRAVRRAWAYTFRNRGDYLERRDPKASLAYNIRSLRLSPLQPRVILRTFRVLCRMARP